MLYSTPVTLTSDLCSCFASEVCLQQGDIPVPCNSTGRAKRNALRDRGMRWVNGVVPYVIDNRYGKEIIDIDLRLKWYHAIGCFISVYKYKHFFWGGVARGPGRNEDSLGLYQLK